MRYLIQFICVSLCFISSTAFATRYGVPSTNNVLIGDMQYQLVTEPVEIPQLQQHYNIGYNAIANANPHIDPAKPIPVGSTIVLSTQHLLPNAAREGIVINLPEMRMYYYPQGSNQVFTYPIGIGKVGKTIPIVNTKVTRKKENPIWVPPADIREYNLKQGIVLPSVFPAGPDNPLGPYAIYMQIPTYLIHSTIFPESVGKRASFGCIRMYETDIKEFFPSVAGGIPVVILNTPVKIGWQSDELFMEAHHPLIEHAGEYNATLPGIVHQISEQTQHEPTLVDWQMVSYIAAEKDGVPHHIGMKLNTH